MKHIIVSVLLTLSVMGQSNPPEWAKGIVWYQIFPERFSNGDSSNNPTSDKVFVNSKRHPVDWEVTPWNNNWFEMAPWEKSLGKTPSETINYRRYGGDLQGLINRLDYLKKLGIGAIYLNPMFEAVSVHKYDASSYHHIDVNFGPDPDGDKKLIASETPDKPATWQTTSADKLFFKFLDEAHKRGLRVVIDGVFNHTGVEFWAFKDIVQNQKNSVYADWYQIKSFKDESDPQSKFDYKGWWNAKSLPEFNRTKENLLPPIKDYIISATKKWMDPNGDGNPSDGIDGWRLDVARDVPIGFWREWRSAVKTMNPNALIIGELWELSPDFIGVNGVFDGLMNYNFAYAAEDYFMARGNKITADTLIHRLQQIDRAYPADNLYVLQNLLSSHDTERLLSMIENPDRQYDRDADERNPNYKPGKPSQESVDILKLIIVFQMTYRGAPMIYYGDEAGMWGADDPHDRKPMVWEDIDYKEEVITPESGFKAGLGKYKVKVDKDIQKFYKRMIEFRNSFESLKLGSVEFLPLNEDNKYVFGYKRKLGDETILVIFNLSDQTEVIDFPIAGAEVWDFSVGDKVKMISPNLRIVLWGKSYAMYKL